MSCCNILVQHAVLWFAAVLLLFHRCTTILIFLGSEQSEQNFVQFELTVRWDVQSLVAKRQCFCRYIAVNVPISIAMAP